MDRLLLCYLRSEGLDTAKAAKRIEDTLAFRKEHERTLAIEDTQAAMEAHPLWPRWPLSFPLVAPDGCPVQYTNVGAVTPSQLLNGPGGEAGLRDMFILSF